MFLWDFVADKVMGQIVDWIYSKLLEFLGEFFGMMGSMGADLFDYDFVRAIIELFRLFGWALFVSGMVVAVFEIAVEYQSGRGSIKDACLNAMKGFMAVSLFTILPVELYKFCISLQVTMSNGLAKLVGSQSVGDSAIKSLSYMQKLSLGTVLLIFLLIMMGYSIIKVFFANLKRGGILLVMIAVGSLVFNCAWLYRWFYSMVQADHWYMSYCIFTGSHFNCRSGCYERKLSFRNRLDTGSQ